MFTNQLVRFSRAGLIAIAAAPLAAGPALAAPEGRLTVAITSFQSENLDPALGLTTDRYYQGHGYEFLVGTAPSGALEPPRGLATSWQGTPDAKTFTLKLRKGVKWHDGKDFTADDVVFSFDERYKAEDTICTFCSAVKRNVERVEAPDSHSVIFHLKNPDVSFSGVLSSRDGDLAVLPRHNFRKTADGKGYEMVGDPIGTGPWQFVEWTRGESITFRANTDYWDQDRVPEFAELVVLKRPEASTRLAMVRTGEADMAFIDTGQAREARAADLNTMGHRRRESHRAVACRRRQIGDAVQQGGLPQGDVPRDRHGGDRGAVVPRGHRRPVRRLGIHAAGARIRPGSRALSLRPRRCQAAPRGRGL